ncbi:hypothetical protein JCGZ_15013 [Jatropha curcas]|uniref:Uncharacterized protein n=1 Tax=Jatropha curcas TaxID=180498 RepID=A0A067K9K6_JATCU|nr:hypothetical protein JCGZ_15013 [Jatropha curcas]
MVGISWQLLTQIQDFLLGTGVLPDTAWGVPGFGGLEALARAVFRSMVWQASAHGRAIWPCPMRHGTTRGVRASGSLERM